MSPRRLTVNFYPVVPLLLIPAVVCAGEPLLDRNGDPLPEGTVARFGSSRLLHGGVHHVEFAPDGKSLATSGVDGARLWDVATGKELVLAHLPRAGDVVLTFTPDGAYVVGEGKGCRVIDPSTGKERCSWRKPGKRPREVVVAADGQSAATAWSEGGVTVHDLAGEGKREGRTLSDDEAEMPSLSGDGTLLAYAREKSVLLWDVRKGQLLHTYPGASKDQNLFSLCLSRDGRRLAVVAEDKFLLWDTSSHEEVKGFAGTDARPVFLRFSADGGELVGVPRDTESIRWSAATGKELSRSPRPADEEAWAWHSALSPDGATIATVRNGAVRLWDAATGKELVPAERGPVWRGAAFVKPDVVATYTRGRKKAGGKEKEEVIAFWNVTDGKPLHSHTVAVPESGWRRRAR